MAAPKWSQSTEIRFGPDFRLRSDFRASRRDMFEDSCRELLLRHVRTLSTRGVYPIDRQDADGETDILLRLRSSISIGELLPRGFDTLPGTEELRLDNGTAIFEMKETMEQQDMEEAVGRALFMTFGMVVVGRYQQALKGSFLAVSEPIFASKCVLELGSMESS